MKIDAAELVVVRVSRWGARESRRELFTRSECDMNWPYLHLTINHSVIMFGALGVVAVILALVVRRRSVWLYAVATMTIAGASAVPTFISGDEAAEMINDTPELRRVVSSDTVHDHEESAELTLWIAIAAGIASLYAWWRAARRREEEVPPVWLRSAVGLLAIASAVGITITAELGGRVAHGSNSLMGAPSLLPSGLSRSGADTSVNAPVPTP